MPVAQYPTNLMDIMSGGSIAAGDMARQQFQTAQLSDLLNQQKAQQDYQFEADKHPLELDQSRANIGRTLADTAYTKENTESTRLKNVFDRDTLDSRIKTALADNDTKRAADIVTRTNAYAQHLSQLADYMDQGGTIPLAADLPDEVKQLAARGTKAMRSYASSITYNDPKFLQEMRKQTNQQGFQASEREKDRQLSRDLSELKYDNLFKMADNKLKSAAGAKNWQQASIQADIQAAALEAAGKTEEAANAKAWADYYRQLTMNLAGSSNAAKLDIAAAAKGDITLMPPPSVPAAPGKGTPVPAAASAPVQLPGGITVRIKSTTPAGVR